MKLFYQYMSFSLIFKPHEIIFIHYKLVVDEDDNGKFRLERVNPFSMLSVGIDIQNLKSLDVIFWRQRSITALEE